MCKTLFFLLVLLFLPVIAAGQIYTVTLRTSPHTGFVRVVLEGNDLLIGSAIVNQTTDSVIVTFPDFDIRVREEKASIGYRKVDMDTLRFSPGSYRGIKVFSLKSPSRLVIDIYLDQRQQGVFRPPMPWYEQPDRERSFSTTIVIDPGHGGYETGLVDDDLREKNVVLDIAKKLVADVTEGSAQVFLTRKSDHFLSQSERLNHGYDRSADVFLSLHVGNNRAFVLYVPVSREVGADDLESYRYYGGSGQYAVETGALLNALQGSIEDDYGDDMVIVKELPYSMLSKIDAAVLLVELPSFDHALYNEEYKDAVSRTLYKGLYLYEEISARQ